jgi:hypothetical protein
VAVIAIAGGVVAVVGIVALTGGLGGGGDGGDPADVLDGVTRLLPDQLPSGFQPFELRGVPDASPFAGSTTILVRLYGRAQRADAFGGGDLGVALIRAPSVDASSFSPDQTEVKLGDRTAYRSTWETGPSPLRLLVWDLEDGTMVLAGSRSIDDAGLEPLVGAVSADASGPPAVAAGSVPEGFVEVAAGDGSLLFTGQPPAAAQGYEADYRHATNPSRRFTVSRWKADVAWEAMWRWWFGGAGRRVTVGDHTARLHTIAGTDGEPPTVLLAWREGDTSTFLVGSGVSADDLLTTGRSLRPAGADDLQRFSTPGGGGPIPTSPPPVGTAP